MDRYRIYAPHKCGSSILRKMTVDITNSKIPSDKDVLIHTNTGKAKLHFSRDFNANKKTPVKDHTIFITRNPISMSISAYYSFGYTHGIPRGTDKVAFTRYRAKIQQMGLEKFVDKRVGVQCRVIQDILNYKHGTKTIIPYELMVTNFSDFLKQYLDTLNMSNLYQTAYSKWHESFKPIEDKSDSIVAGEYKKHKRTTDIHEWQKKLAPDLIQTLLQRHSVIGKYLELLSTYNIITP